MHLRGAKVPRIQTPTLRARCGDGSARNGQRCWMISIASATLSARRIRSVSFSPIVPSASIVTLAPILEVAGVPLGGLGLLLGIDRIPDMFRSATNLLGQVTTTVLVDKWTGD